MQGNVFQFGPFELEPEQQVLRRRGVRIKLPASRFRLLVLLVTRSGALVTREEIAACLWADSQNIDVMSGINTAVNQLRAQLGDDPASPKYIETAIGAGYRFVASVTRIAAPATSAPEAMPAWPVVSPEKPFEPQLEAPVSASRRHRNRNRAVIVAAVMLVLAAPVLIWVLRATARGSAPPASSLELARVAGSGDIHFADISPDGNYVAYVRETGGRQSLWLKQLATERLLELAAITGYECPGLAFSIDGNYVYFVRKRPLEPTGELFQVPFLGGTPVKLLDGISGVPAISLDGRKVAFVRSTLLTHGEDSLVIASLDGANERILASYKAPGIHLNRVAWAGDGKSLVFPQQDRLMVISAEGGVARPLTKVHWNSIDDLWRLPPGQDLVVVGRLSSTDRPQIFEVSLVAGEVRPITHDLSHYTHVRATADGKTLVAVQDVILSTIQVLSPGRESELRPLSSENENHDGVEGLAWTPQGGIVYVSESDQRRELLESAADGSNPRRIAGEDVTAVLAEPSVSPGGEFLVATRWAEEEDEGNLWRFDVKSGAEKRLTEGRQDLHPSLTPDGLWAVYASAVGDQSILMKVSSSGGPAVKLTDYNADFPSVSPDGKWIACSHIEHPNQPPSLALVPVAGGSPERIFELSETSALPPLVWSPDSRSVAFINNVNGVGNLWQQPVGGGPPTPLTHFTSDKIFNFQWSRDGRLILSRGTETIDAVLISNFR